ncbi:hypothetical protein QRD02_10435 [Aequorivita sp. SDUM287046]|uniref:Uncharacterized protein n=1 Tax=Aequorivita aurantiaca TaxID=3053356 RepID=A0ABT8DHC1_9FLAO|nr:hypothetical protein [Aequorivita aurantiaca]MDN3724801.1 hypothetical protein [Aequorivita aurantiaca]
MKPAFKIITIIPILILLSYFTLNWSNPNVRGLSFKRAGTDFTKSFNPERIKMNLPIIPENWTNLCPLQCKIQTWENPILTLPSHSEKIVIATYETAELESETDKYILKKIGENYYQVVIEFSKIKNKWYCTLRETSPKPNEANRTYLTKTDDGKIIEEMTLEQATDTLRKYGIERLNY